MTDDFWRTFGVLAAICVAIYTAINGWLDAQVAAKAFGVSRTAAIRLGLLGLALEAIQESREAPGLLRVRSQ